MKINENRSEFVANESQRRQPMPTKTAPWAMPSRCKRSAPKPALTLFDRFLKLVGLA